MQPLISPVDHESRHNSYHADDERENELSEETPLLHRFGGNNLTHERNLVTTITVILLLLIFLSGVFIGIYLLVLQIDAENVLPPVNPSVELVSRTQWDHKTKNAQAHVLASSPFVASMMIVVQTDTKQCFSFIPCSELLRDMQIGPAGEYIPLPYNFLVSSDGQTFEALGWRRPSPLYPQYSNRALVVAFIGNFNETSPNSAQINEATKLFAVSVSQRRLEPSYVIVGKSTKYRPKYLFESLQKLPQWSNQFSD